MGAGGRGKDTRKTGVERMGILLLLLPPLLLAGRPHASRGHMCGSVQKGARGLPLPRR